MLHDADLDDYRDHEMLAAGPEDEDDEDEEEESDEDEDDE